MWKQIGPLFGGQIQGTVVSRPFLINALWPHEKFQGAMWDCYVCVCVCVCSEVLWGNLQSESDDCSFSVHERLLEKAASCLYFNLHFIWTLDFSWIVWRRSSCGVTLLTFSVRTFSVSGICCARSSVQFKCPLQDEKYIWLMGQHCPIHMLMVNFEYEVHAILVLPNS